MRNFWRRWRRMNGTTGAVVTTGSKIWPLDSPFSFTLFKEFQSHPRRHFLVEKTVFQQTPTDLYIYYICFLSQLFIPLKILNSDNLLKHIQISFHFYLGFWLDWKRRWRFPLKKAVPRTAIL